MSLLNQYLKTIEKRDTGQGHPAPLPPMLKARQRGRQKSWGGYKLVLFAFVSVVFIGISAWQYHHRASNGKSSGFVQAGIASVKAAPMEPNDVKAVSGDEHPPEFISMLLGEVREGTPAVHRDTKPEASEPIPLSIDMMRQKREDETERTPMTADEKSKHVDQLAEATPAPVETDLPEETITPPPVIVRDMSEENTSSAREPTRYKGPVQPVVTTVKRRDAMPPSEETAQNYYQLGLLALQQDNLVDAERYFRGMLKIKSTDIDALLNISNVYVRQNRFDEAVIMLERIRQLDPRNVKALNNMGFVAIQRKNKDEAKRFFNEALQINPLDEIALGNLAYLAQTENNSSEAIQHYEKIVSINPENVDALINYAHLMSQGKNIDHAVRLYKQCLELESVQNNRELTKKIKHRINLIRGYN